MGYCENCGAELSGSANFCPYCGTKIAATTTSISLLNKAVSTAKLTDQYNLVLVSRGSVDAVTAGDILEDTFGYTDAESGKLVSMAPVVVGENLTAQEAQTVAQMFTEYGLQVSITDKNDQYVDLTGKAVSSVFDDSGNLLAGAAAVIGALTIANRISSYRRYKKPSLLERLFHLNYQPSPPPYRRNFRPHLEERPVEPRRTIRRPAPRPSDQPRAGMNRNTPAGNFGGAGGPGPQGSRNPGRSGANGRGPRGPEQGGPGGRR